MKMLIAVDFLCHHCKNPEKAHHAKGLCLDCYAAKKYREKVAEKKREKLSTQ